MKFSSYFRLPFLTRISGGHRNTVYLDRVALTPYTPWGQLLFHIFWRGDADQDPHDHPFDFWTMPFTSYEELVLDPATGDIHQQTVSAFRWHRRPAEHCHRVLHSTNEPGSVIFTLVWRKPRRRAWGFWELDNNPVKNAETFVTVTPAVLQSRDKYGTEFLAGFTPSRDHRLPRRFGRVFVPWRLYLGLPPAPQQSPELWKFEKRNATIYAWHPELGPDWHDVRFKRSLNRHHLAWARDEFVRRSGKPLWEQ